jgi:hypothetical protein
MAGRRSVGATVLAGALLAAWGASPRTARGDERVAYLIETLEESLNYRVRVQSIQSLEQIAATASGQELAQIVAAVTAALEDTSALVRYAAASTLIGLGRSALHAGDLPGVIAALQPLAQDADADVKQLVTDGLPSLQRRLTQLQSATSGGTSGSGSTAPVRWYVAVGQLGDTSGTGREDLDDLAHRFLVDELAAVPGVESHGEIPASAEFHEELERRDLKGFVLQGSVVSVVRSGSQISATVSILVLDQDQNLRVMLRGSGNAVRRTGTLTDADVPAVQVEALQAAIRAAVTSLAGYLREQ